jgi:hypothetical protein
MNNTVHDKKQQVRRFQNRQAKDNRRQVPQPHGFRGADSAGLDGGVVAVQDVDVLRVVAARYPRYPSPGTFVQVMEYFQPVFPL